MENYLLTHPPRSRQFWPSRVPPGWTGAIGWHTTESIMDTVGVDTGAENVAGFIQRRSDPGSYWRIGDADSTVGMVPVDYTTFSIGSSGFNSRTLNVALACRTTDLHPAHWWTRFAIGNLCPHIVRAWRADKIDPAKANRWIEPDDVFAGRPGHINHGTAQPRDRTDAFVRHPFRAELQQLVVDLIAANLGAPAPQEPDMESPPELYRVPSMQGAIFCVRGNIAVRLFNQAQVDTALALGAVNRMNLPEPQTRMVLSFCGVLPAATAP